MTHSRPLLAFLILAVGALAAFPIIGDEFYQELVIRLMIMGIFAMSLDLLIGFTGLISFGHAAFFGLSGYLLAIVTPESEAVSIWFALPVCLLGAALAALVIGWFSVRTTGIYFIMITLAFAQMFYYYFNENQDLGGSDGIFIFYKPSVAIGGFQILDLNNPHTFYYFVLVSLVVSYLILSIILKAPFGQVIRGIHANEARTRALGFNTQHYKLVSFVIAGTMAGFAGFLEANAGGIMSPAHLGWHESGTVMMVVILGGMGTLYGPVLGAFAMGFLQDYFQELWSDHWLLLLGVFVIAVVLFLPNGIAGLFSKFTNKKEDGK
ncbi:MAG: branched-chain amino acid ABC transporter permease [Rhodospirillales bacterium]|nr:branched-chain amino acid ABC transporter permease [Rhodospirillales bacterium]